MAISADLNRWSLLGLIACDSTYAPFLATGATLATHPDTFPEVDVIPTGALSAAGIVFEGMGADISIPDWKLVEKVSIPNTGFLAYFYQSSDKNQVIVSFAGTNGLDWQDWWTNINLGETQWRSARNAMQSAFTRLRDASTTAFNGEITFVGQSLGGALAAYGLEEYQRFRGGDFEPNDAKLITYNGLGSTDGRVPLFGLAIDPSLSQVETAHYVVLNDVVSRLGGGHLNGPSSMQVLNFFNPIDPLLFPDGHGGWWEHPGGTPALDFVTAHRIESGFYRGFNTFGGDFRQAISNPQHSYIATDSVRQLGAAFAGMLSNGNAYAPEAFLRTVAAGLKMIADGSPTELVAASTAFISHLRAASLSPNSALFGIAEGLVPGLSGNAANRAIIRTVAALALGAATLMRTDGLEVDRVKAGLSAENFAPGMVDDGILNALTNTSEGSAFAAKLATAGALLTDEFLAGQLAIMERATEPGVMAATFASPEWEKELVELVVQEAAATNADIGALMAEAILGIDRAATPVLAELGETWVDELRGNLRDALHATTEVIANAITDFTDKYANPAFALIRSLSAKDAIDAARGLGSVLGPLGNAWAGTPDWITEGYPGALAPELSVALEKLETAAQSVIIRRGRGANPFDDPLFADPNAVIAAALRENGVQTFTAYLPFEAAPGGQHISFRLTGSAAGNLSVLLDADPIAVGVDAEFDLLIPEGSREITFGLHASQDVDADETLAISAQLVDAQGIATHQSHLELNLALDADVEPVTNPANVKTGTTLDDNRLGDATHRPITGTAAADHLRGLAGRDEAYGQAGDDLLEGGPGADVLNGDDGADRVFADTAMNDAALRAYIATTAAIVDPTRPTNTLDAATADWLVGGMGDDTVVGSAAADILFGAGGGDLIVGGAGHDIIDGDDDYVPGALTGVTVTRRWRGHPHELNFSSVNQTQYAGDVGAGDEIHAGSGDDHVTAQWGDDTVFGDNGDDTIAGDAGDDALFGGNGDDRIAGDWYGTNDVLEPFGDDYIDGGAGNDTLNGEAGADVIVGGAGNDFLYGFIDTVFSGAPNEDPADDGADHLSGGAGLDVIVGHGAGDTLLGGDDDDYLYGDSDDTPVALQGADAMDGGAGHDIMRGYGGNDEMLGGGGNDQLHGEEGDDRLDGGAEEDSLFGMDGDDTLDGGVGEDQLVGGAGNDRLFGGLTDQDQMWGETGNDTIQGYGYLDGGDGDDELSGGGYLYGMGGNDLLSGNSSGADFMFGGAGADDLQGGEGDDRLWGEADIDTLFGDAGHDQLIGGDGNDLLDGGDGRDQLFGEAGDDTLTGGSGRDYLLGGAGNDLYLIDGASGEDVIIDDEGQNTVRFGEDVARDALRFRQGVDTAGNDRYLVIEGAATFSRVIIRGGMDATVGRFEFADGTLLTHGDAMAELVAQASPVAKPVGPASATTRYGTVGNDRFPGLAGDDIVYADLGDDVVDGGPGSDTLYGYDGADRLDGGSGNDHLEGGAGTDTYVFGRTHGRDAIAEQLLSAQGATELDTLELGAGVAPADVTLHRDGFDLVVAINQTAAQARVQRYFLTQVTAMDPDTGRPAQVPADHRIESIRFADGTVWNATTITSRIQAGTQNAMTGTPGNDIFSVDDAGDTIAETAGGGDDLVRSSVTYALRPYLERLTLTGFVDTNAWSSPSNPVNYLSGNAGNNIFNGPGTFHTLGGPVTTATGGGIMGYAIMAGAGGDDTYHLSKASGGQVTEAAGEGYDTIVLNGLGWTSYQLPDQVEALISVEGTMAQTGVTLQRIGNALDNYIEGSKLDPFASGTPVNYIDGGAGADTMVGYVGDDVYIIDNPQDRVIDKGVFANGTQQSAADEIRSSIAYELPDNVEVLRLTGTAAIDGWGNDLANTLDGTQNTAANTLTGGLGNDHYRARANDLVVERPGEGIDTIEWNGTGTRIYTPADLPQQVEALRLGDDTGDSGYQGDARVDRITGNAGHNTLAGGAGDDTIDGGAGDDRIDGGPGNDWITPGQGYDVLLYSRGFGNDTVQATNQDEIRFDATLPFADVVFAPTELRIAGTSDSIRLAGNLVGIRFDDGTYLAPAEVFARMDASDSTTPSAGSDLLTGTSGPDLLDGLAGDDFISGLAGNDTLIGGAHNDELRGGDGNDTLRGDDGADKLYGDAANDQLIGGDGNDRLDGGTGNDVLDGGLGDDTLLGGDGDDQLASGGGTDQLRGGTGNDTLTAGMGSATLIGDAGDDRLIGGTGFDALYGDVGNDRLQGGAAVDLLDGGAGIDTIVLETGGGYDYVDDDHSGELTIIDVDGSLSPADLTLTRVTDDYGGTTMYVSANGGADVLEMRLFGGAADPVEIRFADGTVWSPAMVMDRLARIEGTDLDDVLTGTPLDDVLFGRAGNDTLTSLAGNDLLDGGTGSDWLEGGDGDDRYVVDDAGDAVVELALEGVDSVESTLSTTLAPDVENLVLIGAALDGTGNAEDNTITGNAAPNLLDGKAGADTLIGGAGNDSYVVDSLGDSIIESAGAGIDRVTASVSHTLSAEVEHLTLTGTAALNATGNALANQLTGNAGANVLDGRSGADTLRGAAGNDTYVVDTLADVLIENAGEGTDTVQSPLSFTLAANFENLTLTGAAASNGTGNAAANTIVGNAAANVLDGAGGSDSLRGGAGNDTYVVDATGDAVVENANQGTDTVNAAVSFLLGSNIENLTLIGTGAINASGNTLANTLTGNAAANRLDGGTGNDTLRGGAGNDLYIVDAVGDVVTENAGQGTDTVQSAVTWTLGANVENLTLTGTAATNATGNTLANTLSGNASANVLDGGTGADALSGGAGNDTYVVDSALDTVTEAAAAGTDLVQSSASVTLAANVENLTLTGAAALNGTGNALANTIQGNAAANALDGGTGADTLRGGAGNDTLTVDNAADALVELAGGGDDTVRSYVAWTLGANLENLTLVGASAVNATGNALDNWLQGNGAANAVTGGDGQDLAFGAAGNDTLSGGNGRDVLQGGDGNDTIVDSAGNNLLHGGLGVDVLTGGAGNELYLGGGGNDTMTLGAGADLVGFNRGDGQDTVNASTGADNTLSLGGGIRYADVALRKTGNDLIVEVGASEQLTLKDWYLSASNRHVVNLQMVVEASADWNAASPNALYNRRVARFDFAGLVSQFDVARAANPALTQWSVAGALASENLGGSDTAALGGDLGYQYGRANTLAGIGWAPADSVLASAAFGTALQALQSPAALFSGPKTLA